MQFIFSVSENGKKACILATFSPFVFTKNAQKTARKTHCFFTVINPAKHH
jgi:hypothetical protein